MTDNQLFLILLRDILNIIWLALGLFLAGIIEGFLWKTPWFDLVNRPINKELFGENKRWRGLITLPLTNTVSTLLFQFLEKGLPLTGNFIYFSNFNFLEYGLLVGFVFNLSELPNSWVKRRLKIPPGDESNQLIYFIDHMDSTYGVLILYWLYFKFPFHFIATGLILTPFLFIGATWVRKKMGLK
jgi:CDP-archaeol synthase